MVGNRPPACPENQVVESPAVLGWVMTVGDLLERGCLTAAADDSAPLHGRLPRVFALDRPIPEALSRLAAGRLVSPPEL